MKKLLVIIIIIFYALWRWNSPYPSPLNWDILEHQTVINAIRGGSFALLPSQLSDTFRFDGYTTLFHTILAGLQTILNVQNVLGFWWIAEGIFFVLTTIAAYGFVYALTKNKLAAFAGGVLSAGLFESAVAFTTLFLLPQTVAALMWLIGMTIVATRKTKREKLLVALITSLIILPFHAIVGALGALFLFTMAVEPKIHWALVLIASYAIPTYIASHFGLTELNAGEAQYFNQTLPQKLELFRHWYGFLPIPFLLLGLKRANRSLVLMLAASAGLLASPFPYVLKFMVIIRYVMIAVMAIGIGEFLRPVTSKLGRYLALAALTIAAGLIFITNTSQWKNPVVFRGIASHVSGDERAAAEFLRENYKHAFLISDPATQYILEPLSGIDTQGGAYMTSESRQNLLGMHVSHGTLLAISARTMKWLAADPKDQMNIAFNIWRPNALSMNDQLYIKKLGFQEVYRNSSIVIFKI